MSKESQDKKYREAEEFVDHFIEFISDCSDLSDEELDTELNRQGIPIKELIGNVQQIVDDAVESSRLAWQEEARSARELNIKRFSKKTMELVSLGKKDLIDRICAIASAKEPDFLFAHRNLNLEDMSEEELRDILTEYEQLAHEE